MAVSKPKRSLDDFVLEVAVDGLGTADYLHAGVDLLVVLGEHTCVGVGVIAADDDEGLDVELLEDFKTFVELSLCLELCTA